MMTKHTRLLRPRDDMDDTEYRHGADHACEVLRERVDAERGPWEAVPDPPKNMASVRNRKGGRPATIPEALIAEVSRLYFDRHMGPVAIARELGESIGRVTYIVDKVRR